MNRQADAGCPGRAWRDHRHYAAGNNLRSVTATPSDWATAQRVVHTLGPGHEWAADDLVARVSTTLGDDHDLGVATTLTLASALGRLPSAVTVVGIEAGHGHRGSPPSHAVLAAAERVAATLCMLVATSTPEEEAWPRRSSYVGTPTTRVMS